jgi:hemoglobin
VQLSRFGWDYTIPAEQQVLLERVAPRRQRPGHDLPTRSTGEPFPARFVGRSVDIDENTSAE